MGEDESDITLGELHERNRRRTRPVSVRLPETLLEEVDDIWHGTDFETRSEFVRAVLREVADRPEAFDFDRGAAAPSHEEDGDVPVWRRDGR